MKNLMKIVVLKRSSRESSGHYYDQPAYSNNKIEVVVEADKDLDFSGYEKEIVELLKEKVKAL